MKFMPHSSATWTERSASCTSTCRNSCPSDEAPKLTTGNIKSVRPRRRCCMVLVPAATSVGGGAQGRPRSTQLQWKSLTRPSLGLSETQSSTVPLHPHADRQQQIGESLLVGGLYRQHVVRRADRFIKGPFFDRLQL